MIKNILIGLFLIAIGAGVVMYFAKNRENNELREQVRQQEWRMLELEKNKEKLISDIGEIKQQQEQQKEQIQEKEKINEALDTKAVQQMQQVNQEAKNECIKKIEYTIEGQKKLIESLDKKADSKMINKAKKEIKRLEAELKNC